MLCAENKDNRWQSQQHAEAHCAAKFLIHDSHNDIFSSLLEQSTCLHGRPFEPAAPKLDGIVFGDINGNFPDGSNDICLRRYLPSLIQRLDMPFVPRKEQSLSDENACQHCKRIICLGLSLRTRFHQTFARNGHPTPLNAKQAPILTLQLGIAERNRIRC
jgi:hypothetical protein